MEMVLLALSIIFTSNVVITKLFGMNLLLTFENHHEVEKKLYIVMLVSTLIAVVLTKAISLANILPLEASILLFIAEVMAVSEIMFRYLEIDNRYLIYILNNAILYSFVTSYKYDVIKMLVVAIFTSLGFVLINYVMNSIRERLAVSTVPRPFKDFAIYIVVLAFILLSISGLNGAF